MGESKINGLGRREFLGTAAAAIFSGIAIHITGCNSDSGTSPKSSSGDIAGTVETNHATPHTVLITKVQVEAGGSISLMLSSAPGHTHTVNLSAADMVAIKAKTHTMVQSGTTSGHSHMVHFN